MPINRIYHTWLAKILQLRPHERVTRARTMAWLLAGMLVSQSVNLSRIACKIPGAATLPSTTRRLSRLLDNPALHVRQWYTPIAQEFLRRVAGQPIRLIVDGSRVGAGHQLLIVSLAYRHRALPLIWTWVKQRRGHSSARTQLALLHVVKGWLPAHATVLLVGDSEFGAIAVLQQVEGWGWHYVLRQKSHHLLRATAQEAWQPLGQLVTQVGQQVWLCVQQFTRQYAHTTNVLAYWQVGEKEPWLLTTNLPTPHVALKAYRWRMWIEEMFGDFKGHGFDLEHTHLRHFWRLSRLTLVVVLLYVELVTLGARAIKAGQRRLVDRRERRDLSIFRIGLYLLERLLANNLPLSIGLCPYVRRQTVR